MVNKKLVSNEQFKVAKAVAVAIQTGGLSKQKKKKEIRAVFDRI